MDNKKYVIVHKNTTPMSQVVNDCETDFCIPVSKGENLNSIIKKLCAIIATGTINSDRIFNRDLIGAKNGYNALFTTFEPFKSTTTSLFVNGQRMKLNFDYYETDNSTITFTFPIYSEDKLIIDYNKK